MKKRMIKKLYTYYTVEGKCDEIRNNPEHNFVSYSCGVAQCIKYHDHITKWLEEITNNQFKIGFGLKAFTEDNNDIINIHKYFNCNTYECNTSSKEDIIKKMADIITYFFNDDIYYYEIESDGIYVHRTYRSCIL